MQSILLMLLLLLFMNTTTAWWLPKRTHWCGDHVHPYYFGTTDLNCVQKFGRRKRSPRRGSLNWSHRWIYYQGHYFEYLGNKKDKNKMPYVISTGSPHLGHKCQYRMEPRIAGYGTVSVDCLKRCTENYQQVWGGYNLLSNNCHIFANRISKLLCKESTCPYWCY